MSTCNAQDPIQYRKHVVHYYYLNHGDLCHIVDDYIIDSQDDLSTAAEVVHKRAKYYAKIADNGTCYTMEYYYVPWLGDWYNFFDRTELYDLSSKIATYKVVGDGWDGLIQIDNCRGLDPSSYYAVDKDGNYHYLDDDYLGV